MIVLRCDAGGCRSSVGDWRNLRSHFVQQRRIRHSHAAQLHRRHRQFSCLGFFINIVCKNSFLKRISFFRCWFYTDFIVSFFFAFYIVKCVIDSMQEVL